MPVPKRTSKAIKINVRKKPEGLVDPKLVPKKRDLSKVIALSTILGFLVGGFGIAYILFSNNPLSIEVQPEIIVPDNETLPEEETPAATTTPESTKAPQVVIQQLEILDTPTGYLNVRTGAGTNFEKITQIKPGESYEFISETAENGGWYQIRLDITTTGWITKRYARIK